MELKANPFVLFTDDYADFDKVQNLLIELFPTKVVVWEELSSNGLDKIDDLDTFRIGTGSYRAQFSVSTKLPEPMSIDDVAAAVLEVEQELLFNAASKSAKRHGLIRMYKADAADFRSIAELLQDGKPKDAMHKLARLDTAARGRIWGATNVMEHNDEFIMFLHANQYPNVLSTGAVY